MSNASIPKFLLTIFCSALLIGCGSSFLLTPSIQHHISQPHVLEGVTLAQSRDILLKLKNPQEPMASVLPTNLPQEKIYPLSRSQGIYLLKLPSGPSLLQTLQTLNRTPGVLYAEPNPSFKLPPYQVAAFRAQAFQPDDTKYGQQWNMKSSKVDLAWELIQGNPNISIAVIDSGVDPNHPDLRDNLETLEDVWNEQQGADVYRNPFTGQTTNFGGRDGNGHGTHVTGIIAAKLNNREGMAGVAGGVIKILPIKSTDYAGNTDAAVLTAAFQRAIDKNVNIINISIGGPASKSTQALVDVINTALQKNITVVSATGNESGRLNGNIAPITVPAAYPGVIAVGAHTEFDKVASYSNGGPEVDLVAPGGGGRNSLDTEGQQIWSTWPTYQTFEFYQKRVPHTSYASTSGTSMACPHVTGVVALMLAQEPNLTPSQIRARLIATADDLDEPGFDEATGYGKLNALRALQWTAHDAQD